MGTVYSVLCLSVCLTQLNTGVYRPNCVLLWIQKRIAFVFILSARGMKAKLNVLGVLMITVPKIRL